jgi:hypothetical protein
MYLFSHSDSLCKAETLLRFDNVLYSIRSSLIGNLSRLVQ